MTEMTVTDFTRNLRKIFDRIEHNGEEIVLIRNNHRIARIIPGSANMTARDAMSDLYRTLPEDAGNTWSHESQLPQNLQEEVEDKWDS